MQKFGSKEGTAHNDDFELANQKFKTLRDHYKDMTDVVRRYCRTSAEVSDIGAEWSETMSKFGQSSTTELGVALVRFSNKFQSINDMQRILAQRVADDLIKPASKFLKEDVEAAQGPKSEYKRFHYEYDSQFSTVQKLRQKTGSDPSKLQYNEQKLRDMEVRLQQLCLDATSRMMYCYEKSDYEYLKAMVGVMKGYKYYFEQGADLMRSIDPYISELETAIREAESAGTATASTTKPVPTPAAVPLVSPASAGGPTAPPMAPMASPLAGQYGYNAGPGYSPAAAAGGMGGADNRAPPPPRLS